MARDPRKNEETGMSKTASKGTALITGASTGIGAVYAERLARQGYDLVLVARDAARLNALAASLRKSAGVAVDVLRADLTQGGDVAKVEARLRDDAAIALLVNNAGVGFGGTLLTSDAARIETLVALNIVALTRLATTAAQAFVARKAGTIVNIASVLALAPELANGVYTGSKAYVLNFSQALKKDLAGSGVAVQVVLPGATQTEIWERAGIDVGKYPPSMIMQAGEMVDAALRGLADGEFVTIPALPDPAQWEALEAARTALGPNLSRDRAAPRYRHPVAA